MKNENRFVATKYRPDIDGLRAVAVLSVLCFHAFPDWLPGGFIGVDIFFVISGYLISSIIFTNLDRGSFRFTEFYSRRIRRIFPSLLVTLFVAYAIAWQALLPEEFKQLAKHIVGGLSFVSNFVLWREAGYFDNGAETKPLLHLWSLGIEEQFYIVYPALLWAVWEKKRHLASVIFLVALVSFFVNVHEIKSDRTAAFYLPHCRFWELMSGGLLAWTSLYKHGLVTKWLTDYLTHKSERTVFVVQIIVANLVSILGLALIVYGFVDFNKELAFPGKWALVPVMGSVLIIGAGQKSYPNRFILSNPVAVWLGLISFPLYLWHWTLLSLARVIEGAVLSREICAVIVLFSTFLAWVTYRFVEKPIRFGGHIKEKNWVLISLMVLAAGGGYYTYWRDGLEVRFPKMISSLTSFHYDKGPALREGTCFLTPEQEAKAFSSCPDDNPGNKPVIFLWGDSHAAQLYFGYKGTFGDAYHIRQRTASACPPIVGIEIGDRPHCKAINDEMIQLITRTRPAKLVLAAAWLIYDDLSKLDATLLRLKNEGLDDITLVGPVPRSRGWATKRTLCSLQEK